MLLVQIEKQKKKKKLSMIRPTETRLCQSIGMYLVVQETNYPNSILVFSFIKFTIVFIFIVFLFLFSVGGARIQYRINDITLLRT